jgi:hypothetical protein
MRVKPIVAKKGEAPRHMVCAVTGKDVQSGATVVSLNDEYWCYVNPRRVLAKERHIELLQFVYKSGLPKETVLFLKELYPEPKAEPKAEDAPKKTEGDK